MKHDLPTSINVPTINKFFKLNVAQRGNINSGHKIIVETLVPDNNKHFDLYRTLAYECTSIKNCLYRENVEFDVRFKPRPIRIDAILIIDKNIYLIDVILTKSSLAKSVRYCRDIVNSCDNIDYIVLIVDSLLISNINHDDWELPLYIVELI